MQAAWLTRCSETAYQLGNGLCTADYVELGMVFEPAVQMCIATLETGESLLRMQSLCSSESPRLSLLTSAAFMAQALSAPQADPKSRMK